MSTTIGVITILAVAIPVYLIGRACDKALREHELHRKQAGAASTQEDTD